MINHRHKKWDLLQLIFFHRLNYVLFFALVFTIFTGILVTIIENGSAEAPIQTFTEGIWWAFSTVASVGYGDFVPITLEGRALAVILMFVGISLFSIITANIASFFVEEDEEKELEKIMNQLDILEKKIDDLQKNSSQSK